VDYRRDLETLEDWDTYLRSHSGLPGPRGNLELLAVVAETGTAAQFARWAALSADDAPTNTPGEFLVACGVVGHGRLAAEGKPLSVTLLRRWANDSRWRVREATAMCLQRVGDADPAALVALAKPLARGSALERRAAVAGLCEPRLLVDKRVRSGAFAALSSATKWLRALPPEKRRDPDVRTLRQGLGYAWSVAVAADPRAGIPRFEALCEDIDPDVRWIARENLKKSRLHRAAPALVQRYR
jgi:HEAT repeat protein